MSISPPPGGGSVGGIEDVPGLEEALDAKAETPIAIADVTDLQDELDDRLADPTTSDGDMILRSNTTNFALSATGHGFTSTIGSTATINAGAIENIHDGNDGTLCGTNNWVRSDLYWWIDLGEDKEITAFRVKQTSMEGWMVESCPASGGFTGVGSSGTWTSRTSRQASTDSGVTNLVSPASVTARYWRVRSDGSGDHGASLSEFSVFGSAVSRLPTTEFGRSLLVAEDAEAADLLAAALMTTQGDLIHLPVTNILIKTRHGGGPLTGGFTEDSGQSWAAVAGRTYRITLNDWGGGTLNMGVIWDPGDVADAWYTGPVADFVCPVGKTSGALIGRSNGASLSWSSYTVEEINPATGPDRLPTSVTGRAILNSTQGAAIANATDATSVINRLNDLLAFLRDRGDIAT